MITKELATTLLLGRVKAYTNNNNGNIIGAHMIDNWYQECLTLAEKITAVYNSIPDESITG